MPYTPKSRRKHTAPFKRSPEREEQILGAIRNGLSHTAACKLAGVDLTTMIRWQRGDPEFRAAVQEADSEAERKKINRVVSESYDPERVANIIRLLQQGNTRTTAAKANGVSYETLRLWYGAFPEFRDQVEQAEAQAQQAHVANVARAAVSGNWTASAWWLERRDPENWGRLDRVELVVRQRQAEQAAEELRAEGIEVTPAEILREADEMARRAALPPPRSRR